MMKKIFFVLLICTVFKHGKAQDVTVNLSLRWEENHYPLIFKEESKIPYLKISVTNKSDKCVRFYKDRDRVNKTPSVAGLMFHIKEYFFESKKDIKKLYKENKKHHTVLVDYDIFYVLDDQNFSSYKENGSFSSPGSYLAVELYQLNKLFILQGFLNSNGVNKQSRLFSYRKKKTMSWKETYEELKRVHRQTGILNDNSEVFTLKPNETKDFEYSLLAFSILGGKYDFLYEYKGSYLEEEDPRWHNEFKNCRHTKNIKSNILKVEW